MPANDGPKFENITEATGSFVVPEGAMMLQTRYSVAARHAEGRRVLELGCGAGQGLGLLARRSSVLVAGDFSLPLLATARSHYRDRVPLVRLDAQDLPFSSNSFDVVLLFEAAYYIADLRKALREIARVLSNGGKCLIVSANPQRPDFIRSPHSVRYHSAYELAQELEESGFQSSRVQAAFPTGQEGGLFAALRNPLVRAVRKLLMRCGLVPSTLRGRSRLKRLVYPRQLIVPPELDEGFALSAEIHELAPDSAGSFKVIYVSAVK